MNIEKKATRHLFYCLRIFQNAVKCHKRVGILLQYANESKRPRRALSCYRNKKTNFLFLFWVAALIIFCYEIMRSEVTYRLDKEEEREAEEREEEGERIMLPFKRPPPQLIMPKSMFFSQFNKSDKRAIQVQ